MRVIFKVGEKAVLSLYPNTAELIQHKSHPKIKSSLQRVSMESSSPKLKRS